MTNDLTTIVYVSSASKLMSGPQLQELLDQSRERNAFEDITGLLLYCDGNFMQCIEGPSDGIQRVWTSIRQDPRHRGIVELTQHKIESREFAQWTMAFSHADRARLNELLGRDRKARNTHGSGGLSTTKLLAEFWREQMG